MYRWSACPGSVRLCKDLPSRTSKYAEEGTLAHDLAAKILLGETVTTVIAHEMLESVEVYVYFIREQIELAEREGGSYGIEHKFDLSSVHPGLFGTADAWVYFPKSKKLLVADYKHGAGIPVEVQNNSQLMYYGLGALVSLNLHVMSVELAIIQPRCNHQDGAIRTWEFDALEILEFEEKLKLAAMATEHPEAPLVPGEHCQFCNAAPTCPALFGKALETAKNEFQKTSYDMDKLSKTLEWLDVFENWIKNVREFAYEEARHGRTPPGWKLVQKRASRKWKQDEDRTAEALECLLPDQESYWERKLKSPAQVEKLLAKNEKHLLIDLVMSESSGTVLVPESDKREAVRLDAKSEFENKKSLLA